MDSSKTRQKNKKEEYMGNSIMKASDRMSAEQQFYIKLRLMEGIRRKVSMKKGGTRNLMPSFRKWKN